MIIGMMATLGLNVSAVALRIYTPVHRNLTIVTLTPEWTIDRRTKNDFLRNPDTAFGHIQQPHGGNNFFAVTGLMEWGTENFSEKRAFWVTSAAFVGKPFTADPYSPAQGVIRDWLKVRQVQHRYMITSISPLIWFSVPCAQHNASRWMSGSIWYQRICQRKLLGQIQRRRRSLMTTG
jgi:hypothetical protein